MALRLGVIVIGLIGWVAVGGATTVLEKAFPDLVQEADTIVVGAVTAIETEQRDGIPFTLVTFSDLDTLKGETDDTLTIHVMGGPAPDGLRFQIAGVPTFNLGDRMVVFLVGNETHAVPFVGMWQGIYRVIQDAEGRDTIATHDGRPLTALPEYQSPDRIVHDDAHLHHLVQPLQQSAPPLSLETFLDAIEEEVQHEP